MLRHAAFRTSLRSSLLSVATRVVHRRPLCDAPGAGNSHAVGNIFSHIPGAQKGAEKMVMLMTCTVCDTRSAKVITKDAYNKGLVLARCPGCENLHLIADRIGWFEGKDVDVESLLAANGQKVRRMEDGGEVLELSADDLQILQTGTPKLGKSANAPMADASATPTGTDTRQ